MALRKERRELLDRLVDEGRTINYIREKHGFTHQIIRRYHPDYRKNLHPSEWLKLSDERRAELANLVAANEDVRVMQEEHGFNYDTIRRYYPEYRAGRTTATDVIEALEEHEEVIEQLKSERAPGVVIAGAIGISSRTLKKYRPELMWTKKESGSFGGMISQLERLGGV